MPEPFCTVPPNTAHPDDACAELVERLRSVETEIVPLARASGRVLAERVLADRDSPACDVSAMDGYAVRMADARSGPLPVSGEVLMGEAPPELEPGKAVKVFTGGAVPDAAECVVRREFTDERAVARDRVVTIPPDTSDLFLGAHIRRKGANIKAGAPVLDPGVVISPAHISSLAAFGYSECRVSNRVRVTLLVTGDELREVGASPGDCAIRDSNGPALCALLAQHPWIEVIACRRVADEREALLNETDAALGASDAVVLTGGVSMGDHDHVPDVLRDLGTETVFHKLALRPGRPLLGGVGPAGQAVLGLPGNPVSALTTMLRLGLGVLAKRAGLAASPVRPRRVRVVNADEKTLPLWWFRPVREGSGDTVELIPTNGSGDFAALASADGFVQQERNSVIEDVVDYWRWTP